MKPRAIPPVGDGPKVESADWFTLSTLSPSELLTLHGRVMEEMRARALVQTANNPTGDLAEYLVCKAFDWEPVGNSQAHLDAIDRRTGTRYQINARRLTAWNTSRQLSALRDLTGAHFDYLAGVLFSSKYEIVRAVLIPHARARAGDVCRADKQPQIISAR